MFSIGWPSSPVTSRTVVSSLSGTTSGCRTIVQAAAPTRTRRFRLVRLFGLQLVELAAELVAQRGATGVRRVEALSLCGFLAAVRALDRQADLALGRVGVKDLNL